MVVYVLTILLGGQVINTPAVLYTEHACHDLGQSIIETVHVGDSKDADNALAFSCVRSLMEKAE